MARLVAAVVTISLLVAIKSASAQGFVPNCTLPFASIAVPSRYCPLAAAPSPSFIASASLTYLPFLVVP
jgi:hypothetical protein